MSRGTHEEFDRLIARYAGCKEAAEQQEIKDRIWDRFGTTGATFISDMANFSSTSRAQGICHFLKLIYRAREVIAPIVADHHGMLLKCDADNTYAYFDTPSDALKASFSINEQLFRDNQDCDLSEQIALSVGIDYGRMLLIGSEDFFGDPVNTASKLGEDLAGKSETLITERALAETDFQVHENPERMTARISDIEIDYVKLRMAAPA